MRFQDAFPVAMILGAVEAHTIFQQLAVGGTTYATGHAIRVPTYDGPINDVTTQYVACNGGPNPTTGDSNIINVKAGDTIQAIWRHTLTSTPANDNVYVVDPSHKGPVMAYMKKVNDAVTDVGYGGGWFKISQAGLNVATQTWAVTDLIAAGGVQQITIPSCIANGQYLLRAELIALHASGSPLGAQLYMECAQINVTGGTGTSTPSTVSFPGAYGQSDPGILINIYQTLSSYKIPGPDVFTCGSGSGPSNPTTTGKPTTMVTSTKPTTPVTTTSTAPGAGASLYGQCGGIGWTGPTTCMAGTCKGSSSYYSQCLP